MSFDAFEWEQPEDLNSGGGNFLKVGGTFHVICHDIGTVDKDGKPIEGFSVNVEVLAGTVAGTKGKLANIRFNNGKSSYKDGGKFARQKQANFFIASNVLGPADVPAIEARKPQIVLGKAQGQQVIVTLELNDKGWPELAFADVFHVDDPKAAGFPKDKTSIDLIPKANRRTADELQAIRDAFGGKVSPASGNGNGNYSPPKAFNPATL
jgi:hypothetical protein